MYTFVACCAIPSAAVEGYVQMLSVILLAEEHLCFFLIILYSYPAAVIGNVLKLVNC